MTKLLNVLTQDISPSLTDFLQGEEYLFGVNPQTYDYEIWTQETTHIAPSCV